MKSGRAYLGGVGRFGQEGQCVPVSRSDGRHVQGEQRGLAARVRPMRRPESRARPRRRSDTFIAIRRKIGKRAGACQRGGEFADPGVVARPSRRSRARPAMRKRARTACPASRHRGRALPEARRAAATRRPRSPQSAWRASHPSESSISGSRSRAAQNLRNPAGVVPAPVGQCALVVVAADRRLSFGVTEKKQAAHCTNFAQAKRTRLRAAARAQN